VQFLDEDFDDFEVGGNNGIAVRLWGKVSRLTELENWDTHVASLSSGS